MTSDHTHCSDLARSIPGPWQLGMALPHECKPSLLQTPESSPTVHSSGAMLPARCLHATAFRPPPALHTPTAQIQPTMCTPPNTHPAQHK